MTISQRRALVLAVGAVIAVVAYSTTSHGRAPAGQPSAAGSQYCALIARSAKSSRAAPIPTGASAVAGQLEEATALVEESRSIAPPDIRGDLDTMATAYETVAAVLAAADSQSARIEVLRPLQDPAFEAAGARIAAYDKRACGIGR